MKPEGKRSVRSLAKVPELVAVGGIHDAVKPKDSDFQSLLSFDPGEIIAQDEAVFEDFLGRFREAEKGLENLGKARDTLKILEKRNRERCSELNFPVKDTPQITTLRKWIESTKNLEKHVGADTLELLKFRETHDQIKALAEKGEKVLKALEHQQEASEEEVTKLRNGYADHFHSLVREGKVERIPREQLKAWDRSGKKFHDFGFSWTYKERQPDGSYEKFCPDGAECSEHWFWGKQGDDQSVALAKGMIRLANANWKIRNIRKRSGNGITGHPTVSKSE